MVALVRKILFFIMYMAFSFALNKEMRDLGFVYLHEIDPSIIVSLRYYSSENFTGSRVLGYEGALAILTQQAAQALKKVQEEVSHDGYSLVVYDAYRPQCAVDSFIDWGYDYMEQSQKFRYYPDISKSSLFQLGYIAIKSSHSRGSTVDVTLIKKSKKLHAIKEKSRVTTKDTQFIFQDDGTIDMGSSFDFFGSISHGDTDLITSHQKENRMYLKQVMERNGFKAHAKEWWHFTLKEEPFPSDNNNSYFNFVVK